MALYKGFDINDPLDPPPWGTRENAKDKALINYVGTDCINPENDPSGHKHQKLYDALAAARVEAADIVRIYGAAQVGGNLRVDGGLQANGPIAASGCGSFGSLDVTHALWVGAAGSSDGTIGTTGDVSVGGALTANNGLSVGAEVVLDVHVTTGERDPSVVAVNAPVIINADASVSGILQVGNSGTESGIDVTGGIHAKKNVQFDGDLNVDGTITGGSLVVPKKYHYGYLSLYASEFISFLMTDGKKRSITINQLTGGQSSVVWTDTSVTINIWYQDIVYTYGTLAALLDVFNRNTGPLPVTGTIGGIFGTNYTGNPQNVSIEEIAFDDLQDVCSDDLRVKVRTGDQIPALPEYAGVLERVVSDENLGVSVVEGVHTMDSYNNFAWWGSDDYRKAKTIAANSSASITEAPPGNDGTGVMLGKISLHLIAGGSSFFCEVLVLLDGSYSPKISILNDPAGQFADHQGEFDYAFDFSNNKVILHNNTLIEVVVNYTMTNIFVASV